MDPKVVWLLVIISDLPLFKTSLSSSASCITLRSRKMSAQDPPKDMSSTYIMQSSDLSHLLCWCRSLAQPFTPYPSCWGAKRATISSITICPATLAARHHRVHPMAMGLIPPHFFSSATSYAPKQRDELFEEYGLLVWESRNLPVE